jgi:hypothetical protein
MCLRSEIRQRGYSTDNTGAGTCFAVCTKGGCISISISSGIGGGISGFWVAVPHHLLRVLLHCQLSLQS